MPPEEEPWWPVEFTQTEEEREESQWQPFHYEPSVDDYEWEDQPEWTDCEE